MIESNVIKILDIEDKTGIIDLYKASKLLYFFEALKTLMKIKSFSYHFYVTLKIIFFAQMILEVLAIPTDNPDLIQNVAIFVSDYLLIDRLIKDDSTFNQVYLIFFLFSAIYFLLVIYLIIYVSKKNLVKLPITILNMLNIFLYEFLFIPIIQICLEILRCKDLNGISTHIYLNSQCYSSTHLYYLLIVSILIIFYSSLVYVISYYMNEIGSINESGLPARVNCNYELYAIIVKFFIHFVIRIVRIYSNDDISILNLSKIMAAIFSILMLIYTEKKVFYFLSTYNLIIFTGWSLIIWTSLISLIQSYCGLVESTIFHLGGWLGIYCIHLMIEMQKESEVLANLNPFNQNSIKEVVSFAERILGFCTTHANYKPQNRGVSMALAQTFEEMIEADENLNLNHIKFACDSHIIAKFRNKTDLTILSTINLVYDHYQQKNKIYGDRNNDLDEENIFLHACYFLINNLKNHIYSAYLCATAKVKSNKNKFLHYMLIEGVKEKLISHLFKISQNESIKRIELGIVLAHQYYNNILYSKINEEINKQCDYFSIFQRKVMSKLKGEKMESSQIEAQHFLSLGDEIVKIKKEIEMAYKQLLLIYPTKEIKYHFMKYLNIIVQDEEKIRIEEKNFIEMNLDFIKAKGNIYKSLFEKNSLMIVVDGYINIGSILYATSNFGNLFHIDTSQVMNLTVHDLVPTAIEQFHYDVVLNGIKYSNLSSIFNKQRLLFVRGKEGLVYLGKVYIRCLPELSNGLNYLISVIKVEDSNTTSSIILDASMTINGMSNFACFNFDQKHFKLIHLAFYIPNVFLHIRYNSSLGFYFDDSEEYIGVLYRHNNTQTFKGTRISLLERVIQKILDKIKIDLELKDPTQDEDYNFFMSEIENHSEENFLIHYKLRTKGFIGNRYKYHTVIVNKTGGLNESKLDDDFKNSVTLSNAFKSHDIIDDIDKLADFPISVFSANSQSSIASSFLMLSMKEKLYNINSTKSELIKKEGEISQFKAMKILCIVFFLISIVLTLISKNITEINFESMNKFMIDNLYFNQTKMLMTCVYSNVNNMKNLYKIRNDNNNFYDIIELKFQTLSCLNDLREIEKSILLFSNDIKTIVNKDYIINLRTNKAELKVGAQEFLNLIISMTLKVTHDISDIDNKLENDKIIHSLLIEDLDDLIYAYLTNSAIIGFDKTYEETKFDYGNYFMTNNYLFSINIALIIVIIILFICFNYSVLSIELRMLKLIVNFNTPMFLSYLGSLVEFQKKIKVEKEDEENQLEMEDDVSENQIKRKRSDNTNTETLNRADTGQKKKKEEKEEKNKNNSRHKNKKSDQTKETYDSYNLISQFFKSKSMFTVLKIVLILIFSLFFYVISILLITSNVTKVLEFHQSTGEIEMYFYKNFMNYIIMKKEISEYIDNENYSLDFSKIVKPHLGTSLFMVKDNFLIDNLEVKKLNQIFIGDVCSLIYSPENINKISCQKYLDNILINGIDQTIIQINVLLASFIPEISYITSNNKDKENNINYIFNTNNFFPEFEEFINKYFYLSYMYFNQTANNLKKSFISNLFTNFNILEYSFIAFWAVCLIFNFIFISKIRKIFLSFMNFIFIVPSKQILEDQGFTEKVNRLKNYL